MDTLVKHTVTGKNTGKREFVIRGVVDLVTAFDGHELTEAGLLAALITWLSPAGGTRKHSWNLAIARALRTLNEDGVDVRWAALQFGVIGLGYANL